MRLLFNILRSLGILPTSNQMDRNSSDVLFMDVFRDPMCFSILYEHLDSKNKATLRLVCKELRDAINLNARGLEAELDDDDHEPVSMPHLILNLPNLESISATVCFSSGGIVNVFQGAQLARKLTKLELKNTDEGRPLTDEERERRVEVIGNSFGTINPSQWPLLQSLRVCYVDATLTMRSMKGLLRLSTLTHLTLYLSRLNNESFDLIQPDSWPCLRHLELSFIRLEDPTVAVRALLHFTGLEELSLDHGGISGEALAQIQPGSWPNLQVLDLYTNTFGDDPVGAMKGLLHLTALTELNLCFCDLSGQAISQIKPGDWPRLQKLKMFDNDLSDDPVGAMKGLLHLTSLQDLNLKYCRLTGEAISQVEPGDWPHLQQLAMFDNDLSDDLVGAMKGLMRLTSLYYLNIRRCGWTKEDISDICRALGIKPI